MQYIAYSSVHLYKLNPNLSFLTIYRFKINLSLILNRKDLASVIAAHDIPYVAQTTFVQNFKDLHIKSEKAIYTPGAAFLNIMAPCPRGWRYNTPDIMEICKLGVVVVSAYIGVAEERWIPVFI